MQSPPGGTDSHFFRWLTAVHVNISNFCSLSNNFLDCSPTEDVDGKFIIIFFEFFKRIVERMNESILQLISPP